MKESNLRNLSKTLAVLSLLAPASAYPLGIGDIKLHSALNQNLNAEISLILSEGEKLSDVKVNLAPPDKFDEAGVPWSYFLSKIKFEPVVRPDGSVVIKLSTREALKEPFLGLLLEVSWPKGSLYREFSVIVDPPEVYEQATIPVVTLPERLDSKPVAVAQRGERIDSEPVTTQLRETVSRPTQSKARRSIKGTENYGPTTRNDTLWKIAEQASRQVNVSSEQMMIAIYQENPGAFFKENINALQVGKKLKIPKRDVALKLSRKQALEEYDRHIAAWKNRTAPAPVEMPTEVAKDNSVKEEQVIDNQLILAAPSEASVAENAVITPGQEKTTTGTPGAQSKNKTTSATQGDAVSGNSQGNDAIQSQLLEMQQQLIKMQEIIALKDQQLAALQNIAEAQPAAQAPTPPVNVPAAQTPASPVTQPAEPVSPLPPVAQQTPPLAEAVAPQHSAEPAPAKPVKPATSAIPDTAQQPIARHEVEPESDSYYLNVGAIGLGVLSVLGLLWWRKRKVDAKTDTESMFASSIISKPSEIYATANSAASVKAASSQVINDSSGFNVDAVGGSSFLSEFTPSDFDAFDTDQGEIDPISEADVYLAYGRYQQAEDLMRQAIADQPDRDECKLKLLEIFYANENKKAFETYANELAMAGKKSDTSFWEKVIEMGNEICPDSTLFSTGVNPSVAKNHTDEKNNSVSFAKKDDTKPADFGISDTPLFESASFDEILNDEVAAQSADMSADVSDFDVSSIEIDDSFGVNEEQQNNQTMEFDLTSLSSFTAPSDSNLLNDESTELQLKSNEADTGYDLESFDFDLDSDNLGIAKLDDIELTATKDQDDNEVSFSLDDDFNFDLSGEDDEDDTDQIIGVSDLTDMDEVETKLDLARAYLDMGDEASAKEIIEGVLEKGSEEQKKIAQKFFEDIS